jgi:nucleoside-diphosphate-sugar epimerase
MKILITGGAGYLGSVLTPTLLALGHEVTCSTIFISTKTACWTAASTKIPGGPRRLPGGILVKPLVARADLIMPLAALVGVPLCNTDAIATQTTNQARWKCCAAGRPAAVGHHAGHQQRLRVGEKGKFCTEDTPLRPISTYGVTKVKAEEAVLARENSISFRLATVFGMSPRMRMDLLVNDFVYRAVHDRAVLIFEGHFKRNYIHIRDVARAFLHGITHFEKMKGKPYNVGLDDANLSKLELCAVIQKHLPKFVFVEAPIGEDPDKRDYIVSNARIAAPGSSRNGAWTAALWNSSRASPFCGTRFIPMSKPSSSACRSS